MSEGRCCGSGVARRKRDACTSAHLPCAGLPRGLLSPILSCRKECGAGQDNSRAPPLGSGRVCTTEKKPHPQTFFTRLNRVLQFRRNYLPLHKPMSCYLRFKKASKERSQICSLSDPLGAEVTERPTRAKAGQCSLGESWLVL